MAIFNSTAFSRLSKSFGNLTTCRTKGINIVKEKVTQVFNPRTLAQRKQRLRMKRLVGLCSMYDPVLGLGFPGRPANYTPDNMFVKLNQQAVVVSDELEVTVNYDRMLVSAGNRRLPEVRMSVDETGSQLTFTHEAEEFMRHAADDDCLYAAVLEEKKLKLRVFVLNERKDTEAAVVDLPPGWEVDALCVYVFVLSKDGKSASASQCVKKS